MIKYLAIAAFVLLFLAVSCNIKKEEKKPNIVILLGDDLGYGELGCYGQQIIETPNIDELAKKGMRFTNFYAGSAVCSPSRAVLMTGKSSSINTIRGNSAYMGDYLWDRVALGKAEITLGELLKSAGYNTAFIGKWHLDDPNDLSTWAYSRGYDFAVQEQWGAKFNGINYDPEMHWINGKKDSVYYNWKEWECKDDFRTKIALDYLDSMKRDKPFFLFMSYRAPHGHERIIGNEELYKEMGWPNRERVHAAKITLLDQQIGRLLTKLDEMGELENTLFLLTSDNGPHHEGHDHEFFNSNSNLRGFKRDLYEGGIRVPMIAVWDGKIKPEAVTDFVSGFQDVMPTIAELAGVEIPTQCNGISILPMLTGGEQKQHESLNWEFQLDGWSRAMPDGGFRQSARIGNWKGVRYGIHSETEIYDLDTDVEESKNVAAEHPKIVAEMNKLFDQRTETYGFPLGGVVQDYMAKDKYVKTE